MVMLVEVLLRGTGCARPNKRALALDPHEYLLPPAVVAHILKRDRQRLIEVDALVEKINRALGFALSQPLFTEPRGQRQHLQCSEIPPPARDHEVSRTEIDVWLDAVE